MLTTAIPVLYVRDVTASAEFYRDKLGFTVEFLHGEPPFYGAVSRDGATLHLKFVHEPVFGPGRVEGEPLIMAFVPITDGERALRRVGSQGRRLYANADKAALGRNGFSRQGPGRQPDRLRRMMATALRRAA